MGIAALVIGGIVGLIGPSTPSDPSGSRMPAFGPQGASAVVEVVEGDGYTDVHLLDPTADPDRVRAALDALDIDLEVTFVLSDPFNVGRLTYAESADGIELLGDSGNELNGGHRHPHQGIARRHGPAGPGPRGALVVLPVREPLNYDRLNQG